MSDTLISGAIQIWVFLAGCCLGSFFNVVIYRLPRKESLVQPGSHCPGCGTPIAFYDNIPLLSYLFLRGRCRRCATWISLRYPVVEALTGLLILLLYRRYGFESQFLIELLFVCLLVIITFIDLDTFEIPHVLSWPGIASGLALSFATPRLTPLDSLLGVFIGGGIFFAVAYLYVLLRKKEGLGGGDIYLLAMIGAYLGVPGVVFTIFFSSLVGTVVGVVVMRRSGEGLGGTKIPYGPFLALGAVCYIFFGETLVLWYVRDVLDLSS